ncbi:hypothetical protein CLIB1423_08S02762 [[Candida] railenensis]|uniref:Uncharacterized protein n=1 Tax=[Candida] railenensis TaxID=45579 RepID=A0A9P0QQ54_9ASCO|nr:hypothetical protein CLIB1423_08S02762 [[Candida] railenensis]
MAPELPGFYYDKDKKKYFKIVNGTSDKHTSRYHNSIVQSEKRKADFERATKGFPLSRPKEKKGKTQKQEDLRLKNALIKQNRRSIDKIRSNKIDLLALKLQPNSNNFDVAILDIGLNLELVECKTDSKFARCTNLAVHSSKQVQEPVLISEFGMETMEAQEVSGRVIPMECMSSVNFANFVRTLGDDVLVECYTSAMSCVSNDSNTSVLRVSTAYVPSERYGPRSVILADVYNIENHNPRWHYDITRELRFLGPKRPHLFGFDMIANLGSEQAVESNNRIAIQFQLPAERQEGHTSYVTSSHLYDTNLFLGTSIGEIYVVNLDVYGISFLEKENYILRLFTVPISTICSVDSVSRFLVSDVSGNICVVDEGKPFGERELYISHESKVTNFFPFENHFIAVGLQGISAYDYSGNAIHKVEYFNNNITNQISIKFGINGKQRSFILVNESNNELRLIHLETFRSRVLKLSERHNMGHKLKNMVVFEGSKVLQAFFEHNGNGYRKVYKFK